MESDLIVATCVVVSVIVTTIVIYSAIYTSFGKQKQPLTFKPLQSAGYQTIEIDGLSVRIVPGVGVLLHAHNGKEIFLSNEILAQLKLINTVG